MIRDELQQLLCLKIGFEKTSFKKKILKMAPEDIMKHSYQVECVSRIHDILQEQSETMEIEMLERLLVIPGLLNNLYQRWLHVPDSFHNELEDAVMTAAEEIKKLYQSIMTAECEQAA